MELKTALGSVGAKLRNSVRQLRYPSTPFEKLLSTQVLMLAGDAMVAIALAGSLFFDISPHAAQGHVLLGLGLTFVPFVVIAPAIGPLLDSIAGMRRAMILISALGRVALCLLMAGDLKSLLLFPESFGLLVLSKVYGISKQSLVPDMVAGSSKGEEAFVHANSTLNFFGAVAGFLGSAVAVALWKLPGLGSAWVLRVDALNFALAAACAFRIPGRSFPAGKPKDIPRARVSRAKGQKEASMMTTDPMGTSVIKNFKSDDSHQIVKTGHDGQAEPEIRIAHKPLRNKIARQRMAMLFAAASAMAVLRMEIGFLEFLLIFTLRRQHYSLIWFGVVLSGLTAGSVVANAVAPRVRQRLSEEQILASSMCIVCAASGAAMATGGILTQAILIFVASLSSGIAKVAFDALVQRDTPESRRGTAFARFETRFQLVWVIGAVIPVAFAFPVGWGDGAMAGLSGVAAVAYWTRWQSLKSRAVRKRPPIV